jgi:hypothetical protein
LSLLGRVKLRQVSLYEVMLSYSSIMYLMLGGLVMDDQDSINLTSLSLLYRLVNVLYVRTLILLLNAIVTHDLT